MCVVQPCVNACVCPAAALWLVERPYNCLEQIDAVEFSNLSWKTKD